MATDHPKKKEGTGLQSRISVQDTDTHDNLLIVHGHSADSALGARVGAWQWHWRQAASDAWVIACVTRRSGANITIGTPRSPQVDLGLDLRFRLWRDLARCSQHTPEWRC